MRRPTFRFQARARGHASVLTGPEGGPYGCPCCGEVTLREGGGFELCLRLQPGGRRSR